MCKAVLLPRLVYKEASDTINLHKSKSDIRLSHKPLQINLSFKDSPEVYTLLLKKSLHTKRENTGVTVKKTHSRFEATKIVFRQF